MRFTPDEIGEWHYSATLQKGSGIAISRAETAGSIIEIEKNAGGFTVVPSNKTAPDFRAANRGLLSTDHGYFQFKKSGDYWLKGGTNSPENFLAYEGFDATYRLKKEARDGEAAATGGIHTYASHSDDWKKGDPTWRSGNGKSIIGAVNYLASQGMNSAYFLTLNILGDGNDVWPYRSPDDFGRFDVSKLEQWNILFEHMQAKGVLLHVVIQETENELMLDEGDTGPLRSLYLSELIARFGHNPAIVWNLGEENGPVHWRPQGQTDAQRRAMAQFFEDHDPYSHPVLLHTHSEAQDKNEIAGPLLGFKALDGLSFQISDRRTVNSETRRWRTRASESGHEWVTTMDEIGMWHTGAVPDTMNPNHDSLRRHALWGHLLGGGAGVEWYFGAHFPSNDLTSENWRLRENLWQQTRSALDFFERYLPYANMKPCAGGVTDRIDAYCFGKSGAIYALYLPEGGTSVVTLPEADKPYSVFWYDPLAGGHLQQGSVEFIAGGQRVPLGQAPQPTGRDWVVLIRQE